MSSFKLFTPYQPKGDQPKAIDRLTTGVLDGLSFQTLLGITGSGKTFTIANLIQKVDRPTLVMSHNKTLAAQLYHEFREFFPNNAVEYFISYYDYYQPEAYLPATGTFIEKKTMINQEIEKLRLRAASSLLSGRRDVLVVSSVACIYGMSNPEEFGKNVLQVKKGEQISQEKFVLKLVELLYTRNEQQTRPGIFRIKGDTVEVMLAYQDFAYRFFFFDEEVEAIQQIDPLSGKKSSDLDEATIYPANLFVTSQHLLDKVKEPIEKELHQQIIFFQQQKRMQEAKRIEERVRLDLEMMQELGYCTGIENYSRYFDGREPDQRPYCLLDYFPKDFLLVIDESHVTLPQIRAMWGGDRARKQHLVNYAFRLPSAMDNRPLNFSEFERLMPQTIFVSATPGDYEVERSEGEVVEQVIRPTGLLDPKITLHPTTNQIDHLIAAIGQRINRKERVLVTTLTKKMAEKLSQYLTESHIKTTYMHSEIKTLERIAILSALRAGEIEVLVGVNLLREGLDLPQVSLVAILDADKEGFLRNTRSLIQIIGRAARHINGEVIMYADKVTKAMNEAITATNERRKKQDAYNKKYQIKPQAVKQSSHTLLQEEEVKEKAATYLSEVQGTELMAAEPIEGSYELSATEIAAVIKKKEKEMQRLADKMEYRLAKKVRDEMLVWKSKLEKRNQKI